MANTTTQPEPIVPPIPSGQVAPAVPLIRPQQIKPVGGVAPSPELTTNQQVLQAGQRAALQGFQTPTLDLTSQKTRELLASPTGYYNPQKAVTVGMDQFNLDFAQQQEKLRRETAPSAHSGERLGALVNFALEGAQKRAQTQQALEQGANQYGLEAVARALEQGRATSESERARFATNIGALVDVRGAAEGERAQTAQLQENALNRGLQIAQSNQNAELQTALLDLQGKLNLGLELKKQDFAAAQAELARAHELAMQSNDVAAAREALEARLAFERWQAETGFKMTAEQNALNRALELTLQSNNLEAQRALTELKGKIDAGMLVKQQDYQAAQAALDRELQRYVASGNWDNALKAIQTKGEIDRQAQEAQQKWMTAERNATQTWQTSERLSEEDWKRANMYIDQQIQTALQDNNYLRMRELEALKTQNELRLMTQGMRDTERKMRLQYELDTAKANGDVKRQKDILQYQAVLDLDKMAKEYGYERGMAQFQKDLQIALKNKDHQNAMAMLKAQQQFSREEAALDRKIEYAKLEMQKAGLDYNMIENEVAAGRIAPEDAVAFVQQKFPNLKLNMPDPNKVYEELDRDYNLQKYQFALANPELAERDKNGNFIDLKPEGAKQFNEFLNQNYYGTDGKPLITKAKPVEDYNIGYTWDGHKRVFTGSVPSESTIVRSVDKGGAATYWVATGVSGEDKHGKGNKNTQWFEMKNRETGDVIKIWAGDGSLMDQLWMK